MALWQCNNEYENESQIVRGFTVCQQDEQNRSPASLTSVSFNSARRKTAWVKSSKNFSSQSVVKQQALILEAQKRLSFLHTSDTDTDIKCTCEDPDTLTGNPTNIHQCDNSEHQVIHIINNIDKCSIKNGDCGCECETSVVSRRKSVVLAERNCSIIATKVHHQEILHFGEEKASPNESCSFRGVRPRTLVFESRNRFFTVC